MGVTRESKSEGLLLSIIQGSFRAKSDKGNPNAVKREWKDDDDNVQSKWEEVFSKIDGYITGVDFKESKFGEQAVIKMQDGNDKFSIYVSTGSKFFADLGKKFPNINLSEKVEFSPYDFEGDNGKQQTGVTVRQGGEKIYSHYYDADKKKTINGLPEADKNASKKGHADAYDSDDWKMFFIKIKKFLKKQIQGMTFAPAPVAESQDKQEPAAAKNSPEAEDDLPF